MRILRYAPFCGLAALAGAVVGLFSLSAAYGARPFHCGHVQPAPCFVGTGQGNRVERPAGELFPTILQT